MAGKNLGRLRRRTEVLCVNVSPTSQDRAGLQFRLTPVPDLADERSNLDGPNVEQHLVMPQERGLERRVEPGEPGAARLRQPLRRHCRA